MNATKRKFNALLNGIGNKSTTSLSSIDHASPNDPVSMGETEAQKRRRVLEMSTTSSAKTPYLSVAAPAYKPSIMIHHKKSMSLATAALNQEAPKYAPWDRGEFLKRLKSFSNITEWSPKPLRVNEVEWAKRGWVCQKSERVRCCLCNVEIVVKLNQREWNDKPEPDSQEIEEALVDKYAERIISSHDEHCLWKQRGCDDSIFKLGLNHASTTLLSLRERYDDLSARSQTLPYLFNIRAPPDFDLDAVLTYLPKDFFTSPHGASAAEGPVDESVNQVALLLALFGWQGYIHDRLGPQAGSVSCQACFRVLGLWLFKSKQVNDAGEEIIGSTISCLDVVEEHRDYCPWRNASTQTGQKTIGDASGTALAGWEVIIRVLKNNHHLGMSGARQSKTLAVPSSEIAQNEDEELRENTEANDEDAERIREENDNKRWARLRRVKSLFDTKGAKKLSRSETNKTKLGP